MNETMNYLGCWTSVATSLLAQALVGEPVLTESLPKPLPPGSFGFAATVEGDDQGRFAVLLDGLLLEAPLFGEGADQKAGWAELLREVADAAAGELLAKTGRNCRVTAFEPIETDKKLSRCFQLKMGESSWTIQVNDEVKRPKAPAPLKKSKDEKAEAAVSPVQTAPTGQVGQLGPEELASQANSTKQGSATPGVQTASSRVASGADPGTGSSMGASTGATGSRANSRGGTGVSGSADARSANGEYELSPGLNCYSTSNSKHPCASGRERCLWGKFSIWAQETLCSWIGISTTLWT